MLYDGGREIAPHISSRYRRWMKTGDLRAGDIERCDDTATSAPRGLREPPGPRVRASEVRGAGETRDSAIFRAHLAR